MKHPLSARWLPYSVLALAIVFPVAAGAFGGGYYIGFATRVMIYALAASSLNLVLGYGGMISFGHAAFFGAGAYTVAVLAREGIGAKLEPAHRTVHRAAVRAQTAARRRHVHPHLRADRHGRGCRPGEQQPAGEERAAPRCGDVPRDSCVSHDRGTHQKLFRRRLAGSAVLSWRRVASRWPIVVR